MRNLAWLWLNMICCLSHNRYICRFLFCPRWASFSSFYPFLVASNEVCALKSLGIDIQWRVETSTNFQLNQEESMRIVCWSGRSVGIFSFRLGKETRVSSAGLDTTLCCSVVVDLFESLDMDFFFYLYGWFVIQPLIKSGWLLLRKWAFKK